MSKPKEFNRREILAAGTAALLTPAVSQAFNSVAPFYQLRKGWITVKTTGSIGARAQGEAIDFQNYMFLIGGNSASGTWQTTHAWYDPVQNSWQVITPSSGTAPVGRCHTNLATNGTSIFIWGGAQTSRVNSGGLYTPTAAGANGGTWVTPPTAAPCPAAREYHSTVYCNGKYIVWGGRDSTTYYNDGGIYDPVGNTWTAIPTTGAPPVRAMHGVFVIGTKMYVWGGYNGSAYLSDGYYYDAVAGTWTQIANSPFGTGAGVPPSFVWALNGTTAYTYFGGTNAVWSYDAGSNTWGSLPATPAIGTGNTFSWWTGTKLVVASDQGGGCVYDFGTSSWTQLNTTNGPNTSASNFFVTYVNHRLLYWGGFVSATRQNAGVCYYQPLYL